MKADLDDLKRRMATAAADQDFEEAQRFRDLIARLSSSPPLADGRSLWRRQQPGAMGLGTSDQKFAPPPGWKPPARPSPMTTGHRKPRGAK
ncbi:MAG: hypothetical protein BGN86_12270 [Caulobacterales bacterium 68-7]|nr:MAG: hypothetical protein BGN86_12270 [Caulobacterales bacterium 68-7]